MRTFRSFAMLATAIMLFSAVYTSRIPATFAQETTTVSDEAQLLYEQALEQKKKGKLSEAVTSYISALRKDRTILAFDDDGLIQASYDDAIKKLEKSPNDVKLLEVCGFLASVGFSDNKTAITYYEKIIALVQDEGVKERTENLIERLRATAAAQQAYDSAVAATMRDERIKSWAEMEKLENLSNKRAESARRAERLNKAYSDRESLQNKIPQLEDELKELQESYDKANRLWYTAKDELYERRRRRLKKEIETKQEELNKSKKDLDSLNDDVSELEKEDEELRKEEEGGAFNKIEESEPEDDEREGYNRDEDKPSEDYEDEYSDEALSKQADELSDEERQEQLKDLIEGL